ILQEIQDQEFETDLRKIKNRLARRTGETWFRILLGMAWLGPGRGVFELTDAINFQQVGGRAFQENYVVVFANQRDLLGDFRKATNFMMSGAITDALSDLTDEGIPSAAYWVGNLLFINTPVEDVPTATSTTTLSTKIGKWHLSSKWSGKSDVYVSEELTTESEYARLPLQVKGKSWGVKIKARDEFQAFYQSLHFIIPLLNWRLLGASEYATTGLRLIFYDFYVSEVINPAEFKQDEKCDPEKIDGYMDMYATLTVANQAVGWFPVATTYFKTVKVTTQSAQTFMKKVGTFNTLIFGKYISAITQVFDPITLAQAYYADQAIEYASHCKDDEYTIIAFQGLRKRVGSTLADRLKGLGSNEILQNLNIGKGTVQLGRQIDTASLNEFVNLKAEVNNQVSAIKADKLFYLGLKGATVQWISGGETCQRKCLDSDKKGVCLDKDGVEVIDKETGTATKLANADRANNHKEVDNFPATIIPNKYITTSLAGCPGPVFQIDGQRSLFLTASATCAGAQCIRSQLQLLTGKATITNDLTPALGRVLNVHTTQGSVDIANNGVIRFNAFATVNDLVELRSPSIESLQNASSADEVSLKQAAALIVNGDGSVLLHGDGPDTSIGQLQTIITERGRINYLPGGQVQVFIHELARVDAGLIKQIATTPVQKDQCVEKVPGIKINQVIGHPGAGDQAEQELNAALEKIQGCNGFQILETADKKFIFTTDENGNPVLRVIDKKTGESTDYKITGPLRQEGNDIIVPTDQGDFRFNIGMGENGQPMLGVKGPNGLDELLPLLAARGFGGVLLFDPRTGQWSAFNGQDLSMDPRFATQGQTYSADANNNVRGRPGDDLLFPTRRRTTGGNAFASLPSWPSELPAIALLIIITLAGVAAIRAKGLKPL
ncbi:hypothetical protein HY571_02945, partial [Candidatus Micrarchaeota archaeon]|nr:hypothetical protein [Candidatus Micrarchaeota archaeon]